MINQKIHLGNNVIAHVDKINMNSLLLVYHDIYLDYCKAGKEENKVISKEGHIISKESQNKLKINNKTIDASKRTIDKFHEKTILIQQQLLALEDMIAVTISEDVIDIYMKKTKNLDGSLYAKLEIKKAYLQEKVIIEERIQREFYDKKNITFNYAINKYDVLMSDLQEFKIKTGYTTELFDSVFNESLYCVESLLLGLAGKNTLKLNYEVRDLVAFADKYERKNLRRRAIKKVKEK